MSESAGSGRERRSHTHTCAHAHAHAHAYRWAGFYGIDADFVAVENTKIVFILISDILVCACVCARACACVWPDRIGGHIWIRSFDLVALVLTGVRKRERECVCHVVALALNL